MARPRFFKTSAHLLLCQGPNCTARGADMLHLALNNALEREHLAYYKVGGPSQAAGTVRLSQSTCLGACQYGPILLCYRSAIGHEPLLEEAWYAAADFRLCMAVAQAAHTGAALPVEQRYDL